MSFSCFQFEIRAFPSRYTFSGGLLRILTQRSATKFKLDKKESGESIRNSHLKMKKKLRNKLLSESE
jgi:hypothetical protein